MKIRRFIKKRLWVEELEPRVVLSSASHGLHGIVPSPVHSVATASTNWAGYAAETNLDAPQNNAVSAVSATWTVPSVTGQGFAYSSIWVGIDGFSSNTVQQIGTESDIVDGEAQYYAWYETYPNDSFSVASLSVHANDLVSASVTYYGSDQFFLQLTNNTTQESFAIAQTAFGAQRSSAEWIVEAPTSSHGVLPLANFGTANFTGASATIGGETGPIDNPSWQNASINMLSRSGVTKATTSALDDTTTTPASSSFSVTNVSPSTQTPLRPATKSTKGPQDSQTAVATLNQAALQPDFNRNLPPAMIGNVSGAASAPNLINMPAFQRNGVPAFFQNGSGATSNLRFDDADPDLDKADMPVPLQRLQEAPRPAVQPMPKRELPPAPQVPMQQNVPPRDDSAPAILDVEVGDASTRDVTTESRPVRSVGWAKAVASVLGVVGAFTLFHGGGFPTRSRASGERDQFERDRLHFS